MHDIRQRSQYRRLGVAVLCALVRRTVRVHLADGLQHGIRCRVYLFLRRGDIRTQASGVFGLVGKHGHANRHGSHVRSGIIFRLEDRGYVQRVLPNHMHMLRHFGTYIKLL